ncbi:MAG: SBBP repeat-containing protein [Bacteroidota bacterium]
MQTRTYRLILLILLFGQGISNAQSFQWAKSIQSEGFEEGYDLVTDPDGNTYIAGMLEYDTDFGNGLILSSAGVHDIFLAKYSPTGRLVWAKRAGGKGGDKIQSIALDGFGNIFAVGEFEDTCYWESIMKTTPGPEVNNMFIAKYDTSGNVTWVKTLSTTGVIHSRGYGVSCDESGNVYACGGTKGDTYFEGNYLFTSNGDYDGTIVKFDSNGNYIWGRRLGGAESDKAYAIASDRNGFVYVTGYFVGTAEFSSSVDLNGNGHTEIFLAKYNADNGNLDWAKMAGDTGFDRGWDVMVNINGNIVITGEFQTGYFGTNQAYSRGNQDMFVAAYDSNGDNLWVVDGGGVEDDIGRGITHDNAGNVIVVGDYAVAGIFTPDTIYGNGFADIFIASYSADGQNLNWIRSAGGLDSDRGRGVGVDNANNVYVCGEFIDSIRFGNTNIIGDTLLDAYLTKISTTTNFCSTQLSVSTANKCTGQCDGVAVASVIGQGPFTYFWSTVPAQTSDTATGLCAGIYEVMTTDASGCTVTAFVTLNDPLPLVLSATSSDALCAGACDGIASASATGESPFQYSWNTSPVQTGENATGLCAGNYTVTVIDSLGCTTTSNIAVGEPQPIQLTATVTNSTCIGCADGSIDVTVNGGTPLYSYLWDIGEITEDLSILLAGTYELCVTDDNGCVQCDTYFVLDAGTGIDDLNESGISVYPNPVIDFATIKINANGNEMSLLKIYSSLGQNVFETTFSGNEYQLSAKTLSKGLYFLQIHNSKFSKMIPVMMGK